MSKIFISYRRDDSAGYAHAIHSQLVQHFSKDQVFMDVDTVEPGVDFVHAIQKAVGECNVLVALIGKRWTGGEASGTSRLDNEKDYVRLEVSTALARDIRVIPVLVDGMTMPNEDNLPSPVQPITRRNAIEISNTRFNYDVEQLIAAVRKSLDAAEAKRKADEEQREAEQRRIEAEAQRKLEEERLREQERQRSEVEARRKADEEKERNRAAQEAERRDAGAQPSTRQPVVEQSKRKLEPGTVFRDKLKDGSEGPEMVVIPAGRFTMGYTGWFSILNPYEKPAHQVKISKPFAIGRYEVTFEEYVRFDADKGRRSRRPVINVSWGAAAAYAEWLSAQTRKRYRLPTEAEWEYAARAGTETLYWWGGAVESGMAYCNDGSSKWGKQTAPVGSFKPNPFGLFDTAGNVWEWVQDSWHGDYKGAPEDGSAWLEVGSDEGVVRGGSWDSPGELTVSSRSPHKHTRRRNNIGFRLARDLD